MASQGSHGGSHEQHVKAGQQSHKNTPGKQENESVQASSDHKGARGGSSEQHSKAGQQSHKNKH